MLQSVSPSRGGSPGGAGTLPLVDEGLGKAGDYPFRDVQGRGGFLGAKGVGHVSPSRNFRVRLIFISPKQYNCRP